eukprot:TRINITY_DN1203_c0_g3_i3.p1 TRINITY_DN1203_c0_g3~~TRINITY_DN1203_c0_g3_i3.p1  ORF type:complete len:197 (-),score=120.56 TRINITY_DN1203_c0_g3_i3:406-996(-)
MDVWSIELVHGRGVGVDGAYAFKQFASEVDAWTECVGALHARHMAQVDVKPDNAVVLDGGDGVRVRLVDFGHAARTDADGRATVTVPTMTHGYRPPSIAALCFEHRRGEQHTVDARAADTHALGVSLRELEGDGDGDGDRRRRAGRGFRAAARAVASAATRRTSGGVCCAQGRRKSRRGGRSHSARRRVVVVVGRR